MRLVGRAHLGEVGEDLGRVDGVGQGLFNGVTDYDPVLGSYFDRSFPQTFNNVNNNYPCSSSTAGMQAYISDGLHGLPGSNAGGSGTLGQLIACDGSNYRVIGPSSLIGLTSTIGGSALSAGQCVSGTATINGVSPNAYLVEVQATSSQDANPDSTHAMFVRGFVSGTNTVTVLVCAVVDGTPNPSTYKVIATPY